MKIAITGANGYIGSALALYLLKQDVEVIAISRTFNTGVKNALKNAEFINADVLSKEFLNLNLACANDIMSKDFDQGVNLSLFGTKFALELCKKNNIRNFLFFSTAQVLGTELKGVYEDNAIESIESYYGYNHYIAEEYIKLFSKTNLIKCIVIRPANIYGAMVDKLIDRWSLVPNCFCKEGVEKGTITLMSSGKQQRNFLSLENICKGTFELLNVLRHENFYIANLASNHCIDIITMARFTKEVFKTVFSKDIEIIVKSDEPKISNTFKIISNALNQNNFQLNESEEQIKKEIIKIIQLIS